MGAAAATPHAAAAQEAMATESSKAVTWRIGQLGFKLRLRDHRHSSFDQINAGTWPACKGLTHVDLRRAARRLAFGHWRHHVPAFRRSFNNVGMPSILPGSDHQVEVSSRSRTSAWCPSRCCDTVNCGLGAWRWQDPAAAGRHHLGGARCQYRCKGVEGQKRATPKRARPIPMRRMCLKMSL